MYVLFGLLSGFTVVVSRMINSMLAKRTHVYHSSFYNYVTGLLMSCVLVVIVRAAPPVLGPPEGFREYFMYFGGLCGLASVIISNIIVSKLPATTMTLIVFISQLFTGIVIDYFLEGAFSAGKLIGGVFLILGLMFYQGFPGSAKKVET